VEGALKIKMFQQFWENIRGSLGKFVHFSVMGSHGLSLRLFPSKTFLDGSEIS
jgi:hypothetical protein